MLEDKDKDKNKVEPLYNEEIELEKFGYDIPREEVINSPELQEQILSLFVVRNKEAEEYVEWKRTIFESRYKKYTNPSEFKDSLIKIHTLHQQLKTFIAMFSATDLSVYFSWQEMGDNETAFRIMKMAEYDRLAMWKDKKDFRSLWNLWFYGANVRIRTQWNKRNKVIEYINVNPRNWKPDRNGDVLEDNFEYHFFDVKQTWYQFMDINKSALAWDVFFNLDKIAQTGCWADDASWTINYDKNIRGLGSIDGRRAIYDYTTWYMKINGRRYSLGVANSGGLLIKFEPLTAISKEEKEDPRLIPDPVNVGNIFPIEGDPMWIGYGELIMDKQNAINRLSNMALIKEQREAWFDTYLVDTNIVSNIHALKKRPINWPIFIPWRRKDWEPIANNPIYPVHEQWANVSTYNLIDRIDQQAQFETNMTEQNRGVDVNAWLTGWQSEMLQWNSNVLFGLDAMVIWFYEKKFWTDIWYRSVKEFLPNYEEKIFRLGKWLTGQTFRIKRDDVVSWCDPDISIESRKLQQQKNIPLVAYLVQKEKTVVANPNTPQVAKDILSRYIDELSGVDRDMIFLYIPMSSDERRATNYMTMINNNQKPKNLFKPWMDYYTYWIYISQCEESDLKTITLSQIEDAIIQSWWQEALKASQETNWALQWIASSSWSQAMWNFLKKQWDQATTLKNVA